MIDSSKSLIPPVRLMILLILLCVILAFHTPFLLTDYFGEADSARIANDSIRAAYNHKFIDLDYSTPSCPLYSDVLRFLIKSEVISVSSIPFWLTLASLISSAIITGGIFAFVFRLTHSLLSAFGASLILQFIPIFWFSSLYGFPTIVSLSLFVMSLVLFQSALSKSLSLHIYALLTIALILYTMAVMIKIDIILASAIYCLPVWQSGRSLKVKFFWIGSLTLISIAEFLLYKQYSSMLYPGVDLDVNKWDLKYQSQLQIFFSEGHQRLIKETFGFLSLPAALVGSAIMGLQRKWRSTLFWLVLAGLPFVILWGPKPGNSARHYLIPSLFLCIVIALPLTMDAWRRFAWAILLSFGCVFNYFKYPAYALSFPYRLSGRLLASSYSLNQEAERLHAIGEKITYLPYTKVAVIGNSNVLAYVRFEILRSNQLSYVTHSRNPLGRRTMIMRNNIGDQLFLTQSVVKMPELVELIVQGYFLVILDDKRYKEGKNWVKELSHMTELKGKWISYNQLLNYFR